MAENRSRWSLHAAAQQQQVVDGSEFLCVCVCIYRGVKERVSRFRHFYPEFRASPPPVEKVRDEVAGIIVFA